MTRILFLTDLHFGLCRNDLIPALLRRANAARPDLVLATGDLTHRATLAQFDAARAFLDSFDAPWLAVPGNHDVPAWNLWERVRSPFRRFRARIGRDLAPVADLDGLRVQCANSTDPLAWERGRLFPRQAQDLQSGMGAGWMNVIALHHPLQHLPQVDKPLARGAQAALARIEGAGAQILLTGHLHRWAIDGLLPPGGRPLLQIQGASALCARPGDRQNEFAILEIDGPELTVHRHVAPMPDIDFLPPEITRWSRATGLWHRLD